MSISFPLEYRDPMHFLPMQDPVETPCKHVFDRPSIKHWLRKHGVCPYDGKTIRVSELKEKTELKENISEFLKSNPDLFKELNEAHDKWRRDFYHRLVTQGFKKLAIPALATVGMIATFFDWSTPMEIFPILATFAAPVIPWAILPRRINGDAKAGISAITGLGASFFILNQPVFGVAYMGGLLGLQLYTMGVFEELV